MHQIYNESSSGLITQSLAVWRLQKTLNFVMTQKIVNNFIGFNELGAQVLEELKARKPLFGKNSV